MVATDGATRIRVWRIVGRELVEYRGVDDADLTLPEGLELIAHLLPQYIAEAESMRHRALTAPPPLPHVDEGDAGDDDGDEDAASFDFDVDTSGGDAACAVSGGGGGICGGSDRRKGGGVSSAARVDDDGGASSSGGSSGGHAAGAAAAATARFTPSPTVQRRSPVELAPA